MISSCFDIALTFIVIFTSTLSSYCYVILQSFFTPCSLWSPKKFWSLKPSFHIFIVFHFQSSGTVISRVFLCWDILPLQNICVTFYLVNTVCNKGFKSLLCILDIPQNHSTVCPKYFIMYFHVKFFPQLNSNFHCQSCSC